MSMRDGGDGGGGVELEMSSIHVKSYGLFSHVEMVCILLVACLLASASRRTIF